MKPRSLIHLAFLPALLLLAEFSPAATITLNVPGEYASIQEAITTAANDPTNSYVITIEPGEYAGGIQVIGHPNSLTLAGRETARTAITGGGTGQLLFLSGNNAGPIVIKNLLFRSAAEGIHAENNSVEIEIKNNIFTLGTSGTGVVALGSPSTHFINNTFYQNGIAVNRNQNSNIISNNIFSLNDAAISGETSDTNIYNNLFDPVAQAVGTSYQPDGSLFTSSTPSFVDAGIRDFHLQSGSPAIDTGSGSGLDSVDNTTPDMGAYGGNNADTIPFPVAGITSSATSTAPYDISLGWQRNRAYTVEGYRIHYGTASGVYTGTDAAEGPSPLSVTTTTALLSSLTPSTSSPPAAPVMGIPSPLNESLELTWSAVPGATGYTVHYGTASTAEFSVDAGYTTVYTLTGLVNLQSYVLAVSARSQAAYYVSVTAYDISGQILSPGAAHESAHSEQTVTIGPVQESALSNEVAGTPERIMPYPELPDQGCFIATAAYGSYDAAPVRVLRAFRDRWLLKNAPGRAVVDWYYRNSPAMAKRLNDHPIWKPAVRGALAPIVAAAAILVYTPWLLIPAAAFSLAAIRRRMRGRNSS